MIMRVYTVLDIKSETYNHPWYSKTRGQAIRTFVDMSNDPNSMICKYPDDFILFEVAMYDDSKGEFQGKTKENIGSARELNPEKNLLDKPLKKV